MKRVLCIALSLALIFVLAACGGGQNASPTSSTPAAEPSVSTQEVPPAENPSEVESSGEVTVEIMDLVYSTNPVGTGYYSVAAGQGGLLATKTPLNTIVTPSTGPEGIVAAMKAGESQLGVNCPQHFITYWEDSEGPYGLENIRSIQSGNVLCFSFIVNADAGIETVVDLAGKRVTFDGLSDTHKVMSEAILSAYGIDPQNGIIRQKMSFSTSGLTELAERRTDACIASIAGSKLEELASKITPRVLPIAAAEGAKVHEAYPALVPAQLFSNVPGMDAGMEIVGMPTVLFCMDDLDDDVVYLITKTLVENYDSLEVICEELKEWTKEAAASKNANFPYHDGAIRYYREIGVWTAEMDAWNQTQIDAFSGR